MRPPPHSWHATPHCRADVDVGMNIEVFYHLAEKAVRRPLKGDAGALQQLLSLEVTCNGTWAPRVQYGQIWGTDPLILAGQQALKGQAKKGVAATATAELAASATGELAASATAARAGPLPALPSMAAARSSGADAADAATTDAAAARAAAGEVAAGAAAGKLPARVGKVVQQEEEGLAVLSPLDAWAGIDPVADVEAGVEAALASLSAADFRWVARVVWVGDVRGVGG